MEAKMNKSTQPQPRTDKRKRILGDLRIFQAVHNDLSLLHQPDKHAYMYPGIDPHELEDGSFPAITEAIQRLITAARVEELEALLALPDIPLPDSHVKAKFTSAITERLAQLREAK